MKLSKCYLERKKFGSSIERATCVNAFYYFIYLFQSSSYSFFSTIKAKCLSRLSTLPVFTTVDIIVSSLVQDEKVAVAKAKDFLESNTYSAEDPYTTALSAYALALLRSPYAPLALRRLNHMAITQGTATHTVPSAQPVSHWRFMRSGIVN